MIIEVIGLLGGLCFAYAGIPSAIATHKAGKSIGISLLTSWLILLGTILLYIYLYIKSGFDWIITVNYSVEALSWAVIIRYHYFPTK